MKHVIAQSQRRKTVYGGCVWYYFCCRNRAKTGNMVSKRLLINLLFLNCVKRKTTGLCNHGDFFEKNGILHVMLTYYIKLYKYIYIFCFILNAF